jgi:hypothetical protein
VTIWAGRFIGFGMSLEPPWAWGLCVERNIRS